jgi:peptidyl-prolyl cis-trans isomerase A (cyclophilin A)
MIRHVASIALLSLAAIAPAHAAAPALPRVSLQTSAGTIVLALEAKRAPITSQNFLQYVDLRKLDGTNFYRAARTKGAPKVGFIQGGIRHSFNRMLPPIAHEPTSKTGVKHLDGTISMAREKPGSATGDFFITVGPAPTLDANPKDKTDHLGYAAFGHVVQGMDVVRKILAMRTVPQTGEGATKSQMLAEQVKIIAARRVP